jgi:DNA-binding transcriptional MerR regulator
VIDIADVARRSGVTVSALRYYEERGLIASTGRRGLRRQFDPEVLQRLALISIGRDAGFSLDEIAGMFGPDGEPHLDRALLTTRADTLDHTIRRLTALRDGLRHAAACPAPRHLDCPTFRRIVASAMKPHRARRTTSPARSLSILD